MTISLKTKPGTKIRVKTWKQLTKEFGDPQHTYFSFSEGMRELCGKTCRLRQIDPDGEVYIEDGQDENALDWGWSFSPDMFVLAKKETKAEKAKRLKAEKRAKRAHKEALEALSPRGREVVQVFLDNPRAFRCQRELVVKLCQALTGDDLTETFKTLTAEA